MSIDGYFESIIDTWKTVKRTPSLVRDMKKVIRQFNTSYNNDEISSDMKQYLKTEFDKIYREVYK